MASVCSQRDARNLRRRDRIPARRSTDRLVERPLGARAAHHGRHGRGVHVPGGERTRGDPSPVRRRYRGDRGDDGHSRGRRSDAPPWTRSVRDLAQDTQNPPGGRRERTSALDNDRRRAAPIVRSRSDKGREGQEGRHRRRRDLDGRLDRRGASLVARRGC